MSWVAIVVSNIFSVYTSPTLPPVTILVRFSRDPKFGVKGFFFLARKTDFRHHHPLIYCLCDALLYVIIVSHIGIACPTFALRFTLKFVELVRCGLTDYLVI